MTDIEKIQYMNNDFQGRVINVVEALPRTDDKWFKECINLLSEYIARYRNKTTYKYAIEQCNAYMDKKEEELRNGTNF